jgi:broad specificity phosphatase PhoE
MTRLIIWRHGRTEWNVSDRVQGHADVDLDEVGLREAAESAPAIAALRPDTIVSSDLRRAVHTAAALSEVTGLPVAYDARLRERNFGPWQGLTVTEIEHDYPEEWARWRAGEPLTIAGIETEDDLGKRAAAAFRDIADQAAGGTTVVVTHGGTTRAGCAGLLGWPPAVWHTLGGLRNCARAELEYSRTRGWRLTAYNLR